ncbi:MAG: MFS transporter, partial [Candidatus Omnitrophota bacterium]
MKINLLAENKNFRRLWIGQLISALGDRLTQMGILTFVMVASGDKGDKMALITFFSLLPFLLFGPLFGALVDRYSRKNLMIFADVLRAIFVIFIPVIWAYTHSVIFIVVWFFFLGCLTALFTPAKMSIIANITDKEALLEANSVIVTTGMVATLIGTLIAGALIKITGATPAFYINSLTYLISALFIIKIIYKQPQATIAPADNVYVAFLEDIRTGIRYIFRHQLIISLILLSAIFSLVSSFAYILILNYGSSVLKQGSLGMGALLSSVGFGMLIGSLILLKRKDRINYKRALYLSNLIIGTFLLLFLLKPNLFVTLVILFFAGIGAAILTITLDTIFQRVVPDELKGKIFAARGMLTTSVFLVSLLFVGFLIERVAAINIFGVIALVCIIAGFGIYLDEKRWGYQLLRISLRLIMKILFNFKVSGLENIPKTKRFILAGNHTSLVDGVALACAYPGRIYFLVADTIFKAKFWGWCASRLGYIPIKRGGFNKESIKTAIHILNSGYPIGIFPEGKISPDGNLDIGKEGITLIARLANADIIPFAIEGAYEAWPLPKKFPKRFPIEVRFGLPIDIN